MLVDIQIPFSATFSEQIELFRFAEGLGYDGAGIGDHQERGMGVYVQLAMAAAQTNRIQIYPGVINPFTRHPWVMANVANTMEHLAPGRFRLVVGAGDAMRPAVLRPQSSASSTSSLRADFRVRASDP